MAFALTGKGYWNSTIKICEAAISMLSACENQDMYLVDTALEHLQNLVRHGRSLENVKAYKSTTSSHTTKKSSRSSLPIQHSPNWNVKDETTVDITLPDQSHITARTITTDEQLKAIIPAIKQAGCFSIDCEFLALKKNQPRLKVLQIAVSKTEGYAIMIDHFPDIGTIRDVLGDVFADDSILRLGWAVRADAQAIENTVPDIKLGPILDLQSLVLEDAVGTMNLSNAMKKYASSWEGLVEFQYAKDMSNSFTFTDSCCIWLQDPLPPQALVYAVFDVVSLFALYHQLGHLTVKNEYYWPTNVICNLSDKALQKWYMNRSYIPPEASRAISDDDKISLSGSSSSSSPVTNGGGSSSTGSFGSKSRMKARQDIHSSPLSSSSPATNDSNHPDEEAAYLEDLERAKWLSLQDQLDRNSPYFSAGPSLTSASASASFTDSNKSPTDGSTLWKHSQDQHQRNVIDNEEYTFDSFDNISVDSANITNDNEGVKFASDIYEPSRKLDYEELPPDTWGDEISPDAWTNAPLPSPPPQPSPMIRAPPSSSLSPPAKTRPPPPPATSSSPGTASKWNNSWGVTYSDRNTGSMINSVPTNDEAGWRLFVEQSQNSWKKGVDSTMHDYDLKVKNFDGTRPTGSNNNYNNTGSMNQPHRSETTAATPSPSQPRRFNTMVGPTTFNNWSGDDGWETTEQQPDTMTMALSGFKARKTHGPKVVNVYDSDGDITDYDSDDNDDDQKNGWNDYGSDNGTTTAATTTATATTATTTTGTMMAGSSPNDTRDTDTFQEYYYMDDGRNIALHAICRPEHVNSLVTHLEDNAMNDGRPLTISISVQFHQQTTRGRDMLPKGLSIYTNNGYAYSIALDKICSWTAGYQLLHSNLGILLTAPHVRRISWRHPFFRDILNKKLGFEIGDVEDISDNLQPEEQQLNMQTVLDRYIHDWPGLQQYKDARADMEDKERASSRKFNGSVWDKDNLSIATLIFSAAQGAMLHTLDQVWN